MREFLGVFKVLCIKALIDHRTTLRDHLEADDLVERVVETIKCGLKKYGLLQKSHQDWDLTFPWIAMGYQFRMHASFVSYSLSFSPLN